MKRAALYVRVSTQEQRDHGLSVDNQIEALRAFCEASDYTVVKIYNDAGISARKAFKHRPALLQLMQDCEKGKIDIILFTKLDRWFRSVSDYYQVQSILDRCKVPWRAIWEDYETETSAGVFKVNIMLSVAQAEADRTSERVKAIIEYKRSKGEYIGYQPYGYRQEHSILMYDEQQKPVVELLFKTLLETRSKVTAARVVFDTYGVKFSEQRINKMLKNPIYKGITAHGTNCPAYITEAEFAALNRLQRMDRRSSHVFIFGGLVKCKYCGRNCGGQIPKRTAKDGTEKFYPPKYTCRSGIEPCKEQASWYESDIEEYLLSVLDDELSRYRIEQESAEQIDHAELRRKLQDKLKRIGDRYEDGDISREEYKEKRSRIMRELNEIPTDVELPTLPEHWKDIYLELTEENKKAFWRRTIKFIVVSKDHNEKPIIFFS